LKLGADLRGGELDLESDVEPDKKMARDLLIKDDGGGGGIDQTIPFPVPLVEVAAQHAGHLSVSAQASGVEGFGRSEIADRSHAEEDMVGVGLGSDEAGGLVLRSVEPMGEMRNQVVLGDIGLARTCGQGKAAAAEDGDVGPAPRPTEDLAEGRSLLDISGGRGDPEEFAVGAG
jgi:hypothetical protein